MSTDFQLDRTGILRNAYQMAGIGLLDPCPGFAANGAATHHLGDAELLGDEHGAPPRRLPGSHLPDESRGELGLRQSRPHCLPMLASHVGGIVFRRADEKMVRPDARRVVAAVKDEPPDGDRLPVMKHPGQTVSEDRDIHGIKLPISTRRSGCSPCPAFSGLVDLGPKSIRHSRVFRSQLAQRLSSVLLEVVAAAKTLAHEGRDTGGKFATHGRHTTSRNP